MKGHSRKFLLILSTMILLIPEAASCFCSEYLKNNISRGPSSGPRRVIQGFMARRLSTIARAQSGRSQVR